MPKRRLTRKQKATIDLTSEWYKSMRRGLGNTRNMISGIRGALEDAGLDASVLDPTGRRSAASMERELSIAFAIAMHEHREALIEEEAHERLRQLVGVDWGRNLP